MLEDCVNDRGPRRIGEAMQDHETGMTAQSREARSRRCLHPEGVKGRPSCDLLQEADTVDRIVKT